MLSGKPKRQRARSKPTELLRVEVSLVEIAPPGHHNAQHESGQRMANSRQKGPRSHFRQAILSQLEHCYVDICAVKKYLETGGVQLRNRGPGRCQVHVKWQWQAREQGTGNNGEWDPDGNQE